MMISEKTKCSTNNTNKENRKITRKIFNTNSAGRRNIEAEKMVKAKYANCLILEGERRRSILLSD